MGEEIGVHIPRHIRGFITMLPGVGNALDSAFKAVAVIALIAVIYEVVKKVVELREAFEQMHLAAERAAGEFERFNDAQKLANAELALTNARLENAIAKLEHKPENRLKEAILEADVAAQSLADKLEKAMHSFADLVVKNAPGTFAQIVGGRQDTKDIAEYLVGKSGFGGLSAELYKVTEAKGDPTEVLARGRQYMGQRLRQAEFAQAYQQGKGFEGVGYEDVRRAMGGDIRGKLPAGLRLENMLTDQTGVIDTLNAAIRQINLLEQSYKLQKQIATLTRTEQALKDRASSPEESERKKFMTEAAAFTKKGDEAELSAIGKIYYERDALLKQAEKLKDVEAQIADIRQSADKQAGVLFKKAQDEFEAYDQKRAAEQTRKMLGLFLPSPAQMKEWEQAFATQERLEDIGVQSQRAMIGARSSRAGRLAQLRVRPGGEMESIASTYQERTTLARDLYAFEMDRAARELDTGKQKIDQARAWAELLKSTYDASVEQEIKIAELQKHRTDELAKTSASLWNTLLTKPGDFPKQLGGTIHAAVLRPITEGLGNMTARALNPLIYGADGAGGMAGMLGGIFGRQDPVKTATDQNTLATRQNSEAVYLLAALWARTAGIPLSALDIGALLPGLGSLPRFAEGGVTNGPSIVGESGRELVIPLDRLRNFGLGSSPSMLVGKYGPETDAALEKLALAGINIGIPAGLSLLGGPAGFSVGETLMSVLMGGVAAATPPRHDNLMMGVMPFGPGGSRLQRMQAGEAIGDAEMRLLFNQTPESLVRIGRKGGLASGAARRAKAAAGELADEGMYTGPEIGRETTHEASMALDAEFAHLKDAFKQTDADKVRKALGRLGGRAGGGANRGASDAQKVRRIVDLADQIVMTEAPPTDISDSLGSLRLSASQRFSIRGFERNTNAGLVRDVFNPELPAAQQRITTGGIPDDLRGQGWGQALYLAAMKRGPINWEEPFKSLKLTQESSQVRAALVRKGLAERQGDWMQLTVKGAKLLGLPGYQEGGVVAHTGTAVVHEGEGVVPSAGAFKAAVEQNTAATQKQTAAAEAGTMQMARMAAGIAMLMMGAMGISTPGFASGGGLAPSVQSMVADATGAPGGATGVSSVAAAGYTLAPWAGGGSGASSRRIWSSIFGAPGGGGVAPGGGSAAAGAAAAKRMGGGFGSIWKNLKATDWGGFSKSPDRYRINEIGGDPELVQKGHITGVHGMAGEAMDVGGFMLAQQGLMGSSRGTWGGVGMGAAGGAAIGAQQGGPLGALIGGAAGALIGIGEKIAGVESPENEAKRLVKQLYSVSIDTATAKQIVGVAQQKYAGHVSIAVRDPDVRKMLMLYSQATGQKMPMSAATPYSASLAEQGGRLYQEATYQNGRPYTYQSGLPVLGGYQTGSYPSAAPMMLQVNVAGQGAAQFVAGQVVTPQFVQAQWSSAGAGSNGRLQNSAMMQQPGLVVS